MVVRVIDRCGSKTGVRGVCVFFFQQKTANGVGGRLVGSEMGKRDREGGLTRDGTVENTHLNQYQQENNLH